MNRTRVFVSSTCYDLSQVRHDLELFIRAVGFEPVLSDSLSLAIPTGLSTLEACKWLVHSSDLFVLIIGGRYGSADSVTGKSVTNIEYETALAAGLPIHAFVDKEVWSKRDVYASLREMVEDGSLQEDKLADVLGAKIEDPRVFRFLDQVSSAERDSWIHEFSTAQEIIETLKGSWSLLVKELLAGRRATNRSSISAREPDLTLEWQSEEGEPIDALFVAPASELNTDTLLAQVSHLRPTTEELELVEEHRDQIAKWLRSRGLTSEPLETEQILSEFDSFVRGLDEIQAAVLSEPKKLRWRLDLLERCIPPVFIVTNSGLCPADEIVVYIQPSDLNAIFGDAASFEELNLTLPERRPANVDRVIALAKSPPSLEPSSPSGLSSFLASLGTSPAPWPAMRFPDISPAKQPKNEVQFSVEGGALRIDIPGRLKHHFIRRVAADRPMLLCFLAPGAEVELAYKIYADNLASPAHGTLRIQAIG
jgi:hypothetical protein